jgi:mannose-6-phosphate isomerase-like protein (cupin superfamily)
MRITNEKELEGETIKLHSGTAESKTLLATEHMFTRLLFVEPNIVCLTKPHKHERREAFYVIRGTAEFSNGEIEKEIKSGDILIFDPYEEHYINSGPDGVVLFETFERLHDSTK